MPLTRAQRSVLVDLKHMRSGRPFMYPEETEAIDEMCRMVPPLVCDPHNVEGALFTHITAAGLAALADES